jgi:hypothetical protein
MRLIKLSKTLEINIDNINAITDVRDSVFFNYDYQVNCGGDVIGLSEEEYRKLKEICEPTPNNPEEG